MSKAFGIFITLFCLWRLVEHAWNHNVAWTIAFGVVLSISVVVSILLEDIS